jgi:hypothetical protein
MARIFVHVEGQTEETFVSELLRPFLCERGYHSVTARIIGNARQRNRRGGIKPWPSTMQDIVRHLKEDANCVASTMVDYYGMPADEADAWPGRLEANAQAFDDKAQTVESRMLDAVAAEMGVNFLRDRFVPFVVMHEFEGLLFSDCAAFADSIDESGLLPSFQSIRDQFETPEHINDHVATAPSRRIIDLVPRYEKPLFGNIAALTIGLGRIRDECPHFAAWLRRLVAAIED